VYNNLLTYLLAFSASLLLPISFQFQCLSSNSILLNILTDVANYMTCCTTQSVLFRRLPALKFVLVNVC